LVSEWTFNSPAVSGKTEDSWGNNDGTLVGANGLPQLQTKENCVYGTCYSFDGVDDYIDCGQGVGNSLRIIDSMTFGMWINPADFDVRRSVIYKAYFGEISITQEISKSINYYYGTASENQGFAVGSLLGNFWNHFVLVRNLDPDVMKFTKYINGVNKGTVNANFSQAYTSANNFLIGDGYLPGFKGMLDEIRIYDKALTSAQVKQEYIAGLNSLLANNNISKEEYNQRLNSLAQK